jgi:short subunit dehydrogenase-like uncharacterized protein|eukprot:SAG25_NODE_396_length_8539_cov_5.889336_1_plen_448_part_00
MGAPCPTQLLVGVPLWLCLLLPVTLLWLLVSTPFKKCCAPASAKSAAPAASSAPAAASASQAEQELDLVIFGATGFTGQLVARYLAQPERAHIRWAIAGRRVTALKALRAQLVAEAESSSSSSGQQHVVLAQLPLIVADSSDAASLRALVSRTKVVLSTVGPFALYGTPLVQACAEHGTDYCDITGESDWVREMVDRYDDLARATGARIVHFCGHDCVPWDLAVDAVAKRLRDEHEEELVSVRCYDEIRGSASGGTIATIFASLSDRAKYRAVTCTGFDPLFKAAPPYSGASDCRTRAANQSFLGYSQEAGCWVGPFVMAMVMANAVRRSNALNRYSKKLIYAEAKVYPNFFAGFVDVFTMMIFGTCLMCPLWRWLLRTCVLPKPGQGPTPHSMDSNFLRVTTIGEGDKGTTAKCQFCECRAPLSSPDSPLCLVCSARWRATVPEVL